MRTRRPSACPSWSRATPGSVSATTDAARWLGAVEDRRDPWLVVVLDEPHRVPLPRRVGAEVGPDGAGVLAVHQPVVEGLVVAGVEALRHEDGFEIPVRLGPEDEVGVALLHRLDHEGPVAPAAVGRRAATSPLAPRPHEDVVEHEHGHVAAHAVTALGDGVDGLGRRRPHGGQRGVELHHLGPGGEVRIAAAGEHPARGLDVGRRVVPEVVLGPGDQVLGVLRHPGVVGRDVVRHEVEDEPHTAPGQLVSGDGQALVAAEVGVDVVRADAVRRPHDVGVDEVGQRGGVGGPHRRVRPGDGRAHRAALPHAHQPDGVDARPGHVVPRLGGHVGEGDRPAVGDAEVGEPDPGEDLVDRRMLRPGHSSSPPGWTPRASRATSTSARPSAVSRR